MPAQPDRRQQVARTFQDCFGSAPSLWSRAPGRVDLMGSHTDYNLGFVLTLPIDCDTWIAARPRGDSLARLRSINLNENSEFDLNQPGPGGGRDWGAYVRGVAAVLKAEGLPLRGFDAVVHSTVPLGGGLSSSAALECAAATLLEALGGWTLAPVRKARLCQRAENEFVGVNCGILDQYTSCAGRQGCALLLDCRDLTDSPVPLAAGLSVVICDTRSRRELAGSEYGQRRAQCEEGARLLGLRALREISVESFLARMNSLPAETARRCRFIVEENARVLAMAQALPTGDRPALRRLAEESFRGACDLYEIAAPSMHAMMRAMLAAPGVVAARQAGAGFGGCMVAFVEQDRLDAFSQAAAAAYTRETGTEPVIRAAGAAAGACCFS